MIQYEKLLYMKKGTYVPLSTSHKNSHVIHDSVINDYIADPGKFKACRLIHGRESQRIGGKDFVKLSEALQVAKHFLEQRPTSVQIFDDQGREMLSIGEVKDEYLCLLDAIPTA